MRVSLSVAATAAMTLGLAAPAQEPAAVNTVRSAPGFHTAAESQFNRYESGLTTHCAVVMPDWSKATHLVYGPTQVAADGNLVNATWVETVPGTACGQTRRYRALVLIRNGKASVVSVLPGESYASPQLEHDAALPLAGAVTIFLPKGQSCPVDVLDTHLSGVQPGPNRQPWSEVWTVGVCGKHLGVPIQFVPDAVGSGTSIHIESKAITLLP